MSRTKECSLDFVRNKKEVLLCESKTDDESLYFRR